MCIYRDVQKRRYFTVMKHRFHCEARSPSCKWQTAIQHPRLALIAITPWLFASLGNPLPPIPQSWPAVGADEECASIFFMPLALPIHSCSLLFLGAASFVHARLDETLWHALHSNLPASSSSRLTNDEKRATRAAVGVPAKDILHRPSLCN